MKFRLFLLFIGLLLCGCSKKHAPPEVIVDGTPLTSLLTNYFNQKPELFDETMAKVGTNAVPTLLWMLQQTNRAQNQAAYFAFLKLGASAQEAVPALIQIYESRITPFSQQCAAGSIASVGQAGNSAIPVLIRGLEDPNVLVRCDTLTALGHLNSQPDLVMPALTNAFNDPSPRVRISACIALGEVGERSKEVVPSLTEAAAHDPDSMVRENAAMTLHGIEFEARMLPLMKQAKPSTAPEPTPADETTRMIHFQDVPVSVVLPIYQSLSGLELIIDSRAKQVSSTITVKSPKPLSDADAAEFIEKTLLTQAAIVITRLDDKHASVTYNDALTTTR